MVAPEKMEVRYAQLRKRLDAKGYRDVLSVDAVPLIEKLFNDFIITSEKLKSTTSKSDYFEKIATELEEGVAPFKEENVRLIKENSTLRLSLLRTSERVEEKVAGSKVRLQDLEAENKDLKQLRNKFVQKINELESDLKRKSSKILLLQERNLEAQIVGPGGEKLSMPTKKQRMEISSAAEPLCPHCVRIRNCVQYGNKDKEPGTMDYIKLADSRIEALQLQLRHMKRNETDLVNAITCLKSKVEGREEEINKLQGMVQVKAGGITKDKDTDPCSAENVRVSLRAAQMQLNILQLRNLQLERKLQAYALKDRGGSRSKTTASKSSATGLTEDYPGYDAVKLQEKVHALEAQLSHCCSEKAKLKFLLEECESREKHFTTPRSPNAIELATKMSNGHDKVDILHKGKSALRTKSEEVTKEQEDKKRSHKSLNTNSTTDTRNLTKESSHNIISVSNRSPTKARSSSGATTSKSKTALTEGESSTERELKLQEQVRSLQSKLSDCYSENDKLKYLLEDLENREKVSSKSPKKVISSSEKLQNNGYSVRERRSGGKLTKSKESVKVDHRFQEIPEKTLRSSTSRLRSQEINGETHFKAANGLLQTESENGSADSKNRKSTLSLIADSLTNRDNQLLPSETTTMFDKQNASDLPRISDSYKEEVEILKSDVRKKEDEIQNLRKSNQELELRLRSAQVQELQDRSVATDIVPSNVEGNIETSESPSGDLFTLKEKVRSLEAQLARCVGEKYRLKTLLEECEDRKKRPRSPKTGELSSEKLNGQGQDNFSNRQLESTKKDIGKEIDDILEEGLRNAETSSKNKTHSQEVVYERSQSKARSNSPSYEKFSERDETIHEKGQPSAVGTFLNPDTSKIRGSQLQPNEVRRTVDNSDRSEILRLNSDIESYKEEIKRLRTFMYRKEDEIDGLRKENQDLERRLRVSQIREPSKGPSYGVFSTDQEMEREIGSLKFALKALDRDKDEMRLELDKKDEKLFKLQTELSQNLDEIGRLQLRLKNAELELGRTSDTSRDHEREVGLHKRQLTSLRNDLEQMIKERDAARKEAHRLSQTHSVVEKERRSVSVELENRTKEADDLRKQVQRYVDEVRRIEDLLQQKEEEYEAILEHYRTLSDERTTLENHRTSLERETDAMKHEVREALADNSLLRAKLTTLDTLNKSYEEEIEKLTQRVATLEIQLNNTSDSEKTLQSDTAISRDLCMKLENSLSKLRLELANAESSRATTEASNRELQAYISKLEAVITEEQEKYNKLEELVGQLREQEFALQKSIQDLLAEKQDLIDRCATLSTKFDNVNKESGKYRLKCTQLQTDLEILQRQFKNEKSERENAVDELKRLQQQLHTSSTNLLLQSALGTSSSPGSGFSPQTDFQHVLSPGQSETPLGASTSRTHVENLRSGNDSY